MKRILIGCLVIIVVAAAVITAYENARFAALLGSKVNGDQVAINQQGDTLQQVLAQGQQRYQALENEIANLKARQSNEESQIASLEKQIAGLQANPPSQGPPGPEGPPGPPGPPGRDGRNGQNGANGIDHATVCISLIYNC